MCFIDWHIKKHNILLHMQSVQCKQQQKREGKKMEMLGGEHTSNSSTGIYSP